MRRGTVIVLVWLAFLADLIVGAGFLLSESETFFVVGIAMVLGACLGMAGLTLWYYVQQRRGRSAATPPRQG